MNKIFRVKWNSNLQRLDVTSELTTGKTKSTRVSPVSASEKKQPSVFFCLSLLAVLISLPVKADNIELSNFESTNRNNTQYIEGIDTLVSLDGFNRISSGKAGFTTMTFQDAFNKGILQGDGTPFLDKTLTLGNKVGVDYINPITHNRETFQAFDSNQLRQGSLLSTPLEIKQIVGKDGQYVDRNLIELVSGSRLDVDIGANDQGWYNKKTNRLLAYLKGSKASPNFISSIFKVNNDSTLNYKSKTIAQLGNMRQNQIDKAQSDVTSFYAGYKGVFESAIGTQNVSNVDSLKKYNDALIKAVKDGSIKFSQYESEFNKALGGFKFIYADYSGFENDPIGDDINAGRVAFILADGSSAVINVDSNSSIQLYSSNASIVSLTNGALLINNGELGSFSNTSLGSEVIHADNSTVINNGVLDVGTNPEMIDYKYDVNDKESIGIDNATFGPGTGVNALNGSEIVNNGIVNVAPRQQYNDNIGINLDSSNFTNKGIINVSASKEPKSYVLSGRITRGVNLSGASKFYNEGMMYLGRQNQRDDSEPTVDIDTKNPGNVLVSIHDRSTFTNILSGEMVIGNKVQGSVAIDAQGINSSTTNLGKIDINGAADGVADNAPLQNIGMRAINNAQYVLNGHDGVINLNGINAIAMQADTLKTPGSTAIVRNEGIINIEAGINLKTGTANYGLWAQGKLSRAINSNTINVNGDRAIGAHARDGGTLEVSNTAKMHFSNGIGQLGYYVYGPGSAIVDNSASTQNASTKDSTMYRIDGGASFDGTGNNSEIESSGENATGLLITSKNQTSQFNSGNMTLTVSGEGSTGVRVMGNAKGILSENTLLTLSGTGSTAGIVDGSYTDITGNNIADFNGDASLISYTKIDDNIATSANAIGFIARNGGMLDQRGNIIFTAAETTGVLVDGGSLNNSGNINANGVGVNIQGASSVITNTGNIAASDGEAAIKVGEGASLTLNGLGMVKASGSAHGILLDTNAAGLTVKDAIIDLESTGDGNAIENKAEIAGIKLENTAIMVNNGAGVRTAASMAASNSGTITVNGSGVGIFFGKADGSSTDKDFDTLASQGLVINVGHDAGSGIITSTSGDVHSGISVNVRSETGGPALMVKGSTRNVIQAGMLTSASKKDAVVDLANGYLTNFINKGTIRAAGLIHDAIRVTTGSNLNFTNAQGGHITGRVALSDGNNSVTLEGGSTATDVVTGSGNDNFYLNGILLSDTDIFRTLQAGAGSDTLNLNDSELRVTEPDALTGFEKIALTNRSVLMLDDTLLPLGDQADDAAGTDYVISRDSILNVNTHGNTAFASHLRGDGILAASTGGSVFDFTTNNAAGMGRNFSGTLALSDTHFNLDGLNTQAVAIANVQVGESSIVHVADGMQHIGGLSFEGGTVTFNTGTPGETVAKSSVQTSNLLDVSGSGVVQVNAGTVDNSPFLQPDTLPLMEHDDVNTSLKLAGSDGAIIGSGGNLVLKDQHGNVISDALIAQVRQEGKTVANAIYDYRLTSGAATDGLYINYGLTELELITQGSDALMLNAYGQTGNASDLSARVTGSGDLAIDTGTGQLVSLSSSSNDYIGKTDLRSGTLLMNNSNVLGQTSELAMASGTGFDMNGHSQTVGILNTASDSVVNIAGGVLDITNGGTVDGTLQGAGSLNVNGGTLTVNGSNSALLVTTSIATGSDVQLNQTGGLGLGSIINNGLLMMNNAAGNLFNNLSGTGETQVASTSDVRLLGDNSAFSGRFNVDSESALTATHQNSLGRAAVNNAGMLNLASAESWTLNNSITGKGILNQNGSGVVTLAQLAAQFSGDTSVNSGGLQLGEAGSDVTLASRNLNVSSGAFAGGFGGTEGNVNNHGTLMLGALKPATRAFTDAMTFNVGGNLSNAGEVMVGRAGGTAGNLLHVAGNYAGSNGHLTFNTALADDNSITDKMLVDGDTSGSTRVSVNNAGGSGAKTLNGIELIRVNGASAGEFVQEGRIVAGAYDYHLKRGEGSYAANWYLSNTLNDGGEGEGGTEPESEVVKVYRPESGAYASNMAAANMLFNTRLHDRLGETHYVDALTNEKKVTSMWQRNVGGHTRSSDSSGQMKTRANRYVMQMGGDIAQLSSDGTDRYHLGVMAGYANQKSNSRNGLTGQKANGSINGYSVGAYATWLQDNDEKTGAYIDTWAQYSWFNNSVKGDSLTAESYKSKGITASVESGYTWKIGEKNERDSYYIQPKAQLTWMGVEADSIREANGTHVDGVGDGNVQARLGVRAFFKGHSLIDNGKNRTFEPFIEANWIGNTKAFGSQLNGVAVTQKGAHNLGEMKVGIEGQIKPGVNLWANIGQQIGDAGYSDTSALLGIKVSF